MKTVVFLILLSVIVTLLPGTASAAGYRYLSSPASASVNGVRFYVVVQGNVEATNIRAEGIVDARQSSFAGRIEFIELYYDPSLPNPEGPQLVALYNDREATNDYRSEIAGPIECNANGTYYARMKYHIDGTSITRYLTTPVVSPNSPLDVC